MSSNDMPKDPFDLAEQLKRIADAWNEGLEQAKRQSECKMRRFYRVDRATNETNARGIVFPDGTAVLQEHGSGDIHVYRHNGLTMSGVNKVKTTSHRVDWIDPEATS